MENQNERINTTKSIWLSLILRVAALAIVCGLIKFWAPKMEATMWESGESISQNMAKDMLDAETGKKDDAAAVGALGKELSPLGPEGEPGQDKTGGQEGDTSGENSGEMGNNGATVADPGNGEDPSENGDKEDPGETGGEQKPSVNGGGTLTGPHDPDEGGPKTTDDILTVSGLDGDYVLSSEGISINNETGYGIDVDELLSSKLAFSANTGGKVLIIHTHGTEAFTPSGSDTYVASDPYRTLNNDQNMIRVGNELQRVLEERGIEVIHDTDFYDYPDYEGAYDRALVSIKKHLGLEDEICTVIDLHRDAAELPDGTAYKTVADIGDEPSAQILLIAGSDWTGLEHPNWRENLKFALKLQASMVGKYPTLARPLKLSKYRYNQGVTTGSLIVEVGCNGNTLQEAITAVAYFGDCLADILLDR